MAKLKISGNSKVSITPEDDDILAVFKYTRRQMLEDAAIAQNGKVAGDLRVAAEAIENVLWYYTVGGMP